MVDYKFAKGIFNVGGKYFTESEANILECND